MNIYNDSKILSGVEQLTCSITQHGCITYAPQGRFLECDQQGVGAGREAFPCKLKHNFNVKVQQLCVFKYFSIPLFWLDSWRIGQEMGEREEMKSTKGPQGGIEPVAAAVRTKVLYMGRPLDQLSHWGATICFFVLNSHFFGFLVS